MATDTGAVVVVNKALFVNTFTFISKYSILCDGFIHNILYPNLLIKSIDDYRQHTSECKHTESVYEINNIEV